MKDIAEQEVIDIGDMDVEAFNDFAPRVGAKAFEDKVRELSLPVEFNVETMNTFIDWNRDVPFAVVRGEGECAV